MFSKKIENKGLIFYLNKEKVINLHMFFVFFSIDIIWLDSEKRVIQLKENARPFTPLIKAKYKAKYILELPVKTIKNSNTKINDIVSF